MLADVICMLMATTCVQGSVKGHKTGGKGKGRKEKVTAEMRRQARKAREAAREEKAAADRKEREEIFEVGHRIIWHSGCISLAVIVPLFRHAMPCQGLALMPMLIQKCLACWYKVSVFVLTKWMTPCCAAGWLWWYVP